MSLTPFGGGDVEPAPWLNISTDDRWILMMAISQCPFLTRSVWKIRMASLENLWNTWTNLKHWKHFCWPGGVCWAFFGCLASCRSEINPIRRHGWNLHWEWRCWWRRQRILASRASMRRLGHDPVPRMQFHLCFIKKTWAGWHKTTAAYLPPSVLRILLGFVTLHCGYIHIRCRSSTMGDA